MSRIRLLVLGIVILVALAVAAIAGVGLIHSATVVEKKMASIARPRVTVSFTNSGGTPMSCTRRSTTLGLGGIRIGEAVLKTCRSRVGEVARP